MALKGVEYKGPDPKYVQILESELAELREVVTVLAAKAGVKVKKG